MAYFSIFALVMSILTRTGIILLLLIYIAGSIGLSVTHHMCTAGHSSEIVGIEGIRITDAEAGCCCHEWEKNCTADLTEPIGLSITAEPCCTDITDYLQLDTGPYLAGLQMFKVPLPDWIVLLQQENTPSEACEQSDFLILYPPGPPLSSGTKLVYFLHQIKIPSA